MVVFVGVCLTVCPLTLERFNFFKFWFRKFVKGFNSEVKFDDAHRRSTRSGSKKVSSKLIMSTYVQAQVSSVRTFALTQHPSRVVPHLECTRVTMGFCDNYASV